MINLHLAVVLRKAVDHPKEGAKCVGKPSQRVPTRIYDRLCSSITARLRLSVQLRETSQLYWV